MHITGRREETVRASAESCFEILTDYAAYPEWWPGCRSATVVSGSPSAGEHEVEFVFDTNSPVGEIDFRLRFEVEPPSRIRPVGAAGRLTKVGGDGWTLTPRGAETDVRYVFEAEMETGMPGLLERPFRSKARQYLIDAPVERLKLRAELH